MEAIRLANQIDAAAVRQAEIDHHDLKIQSLDQLLSFMLSRSKADDLHHRVLINGGFKTAPNFSVIFNKQNRDCLFRHL